MTISSYNQAGTETLRQHGLSIILVKDSTEMGTGGHRSMTSEPVLYYSLETLVKLNMSTDSTRRSTRSKSSSDEPPTAPAQPQKSADQLAEEREKRRERLLAGRDSRLTKIVSSVGGTNFTPPSNMASPANIVTRREGGAIQSSGEGSAKASKAEKHAPTPAASTENEQTPSQNVMAGPTSERMQTILILLVNLGALFIGHWLLGKSCLKALFRDDCKADCRCDFARNSYVGLLAVVISPIIIGHAVAKNYFAIISTIVSTICLSISLLVLVGHFIGRF